MRSHQSECAIDYREVCKYTRHSFDNFWRVWTQVIWVQEHNGQWRRNRCEHPNAKQDHSSDHGLVIWEVGAGGVDPRQVAQNNSDSVGHAVHLYEDIIVFDPYHDEVDQCEESRRWNSLCWIRSSRTATRSTRTLSSERWATNGHHYLGVFPVLVHCRVELAEVVRDVDVYITDQVVSPDHQINSHRACQRYFL